MTNTSAIACSPWRIWASLSKKLPLTSKSGASSLSLPRRNTCKCVLNCTIDVFLIVKIKSSSLKCSPLQTSHLSCMLKSCNHMSMQLISPLHLAFHDFMFEILSCLLFEIYVAFSSCMFVPLYVILYID